LVTVDHHSVFINALIRRLHTRRDFEAIQTMQNVFLKVHSDFLTANAEMREGLERLGEAHRKESQRVLELLASSLGTLGFVRSSVLQ
jgi:U3 small nucleolar RNA-associated protein 21